MPAIALPVVEAGESHFGGRLAASSVESLLEDALPMWVVLVVIVCLLLAVGLYVSLMSSGIVPGPDRTQPADLGGGRTSYRTFGGDQDRDAGSGLFGIFPRVPHLREMPQGCLLALIVASALWFLGWTVLLVLAIGLLRSIS